MKLRPCCRGSRQISERSKTCTDPPFSVYTGPAEFARFARVKNSSDQQFVRTRVNGISESREQQKYFWNVFVLQGNSLPGKQN